MIEGKEKHKNRLKERGVTLIALVITIIVLLILAGVTLTTLTGDSGILNNAEKAKENTEIANEKELISLARMAAKVETKTGNITAKEMQEAINSIARRK